MVEYLRWDGTRNGLGLSIRSATARVTSIVPRLHRRHEKKQPRVSCIHTYIKHKGHRARQLPRAAKQTAKAKQSPWQLSSVRKPPQASKQASTVNAGSAPRNSSRGMPGGKTRNPASQAKQQTHDARPRKNHPWPRNPSASRGSPEKTPLDPYSSIQEEILGALVW